MRVQYIYMQMDCEAHNKIDKDMQLCAVIQLGMCTKYVVVL